MSDPTDELVGEYLRLGLALDRHQEGIVDAYYGPESLKDEVDGSPLPSLGKLGAVARELITRLDNDGAELDAQRRAWLRAQCVGLAMVCRVLDGDKVAYLNEVEACFGVSPAPVTPEEVAEAHLQLDNALEGSGPLAERVAQARKRHVIPRERIPEVIEATSALLRTATAEKFGLPDGEGVEFLLETDKPYSGFNYYDGDLQSRVAINTDLPLSSPSVPHLVAHEAYPGHHTEHCHKEVGLVRDRNYAEESIFLIGTPSCLMAEGIGDVALEALLGDEVIPAFAPLMESLGVIFEPDVVEAFSAFAELSTRYRGTLAIDLHDRHRPVAEVVEDAQRQLLVDADRAKKTIEFLTHPTWRAYVFCYSEGYRLCSAYARRSTDGFSRLLSEQLTPADLA